MEISLVPNLVTVPQTQVKERGRRNKGAVSTLLGIFRTKIKPQYSIENVFLIFLLVSLTFGGRYLYIEKFSDEYYLEIRIY